MCRLLLSEIHETEALSPKSSSAATLTLMNQKDPSSSSIVSVLCLVISGLALIIVFLGVLYLIFLHDSGLDQTAIDALPVFLYGNVTISLEQPFDCAVCLNEFSDTDKLRLLPVCSHAFHLHCIDTWLLSNSTCPLCRRSLSTSNVCYNHSETLVAPLSGHQQVDDGKASLAKRVFSVRLGRFKSTNESQSQRHDVKDEIGVRMPRRCYSMGTQQYLVCDQDFVVALSSSPREGNIGR